MEYEGTKDSDNEHGAKTSDSKQKMNLSHEDLSDVSDLDSLGGGSDDETEDIKTADSEPKSPLKTANDLRHKLDEAKNRKMNDKQINPPEKTSKTEDGEEQLDFEAEDGECVEDTKPRSEKDEGNHIEIVERAPKEPTEEVLIFCICLLGSYL